VDKGEYYFDRFGPAKAVVLARFIPSCPPSSTQHEGLPVRLVSCRLG